MKSTLLRFTFLLSSIMLLLVHPTLASATNPTGGGPGKTLKKSTRSVQLTTENLYSAMMAGDNLGNHTATAPLDMNVYAIDFGTGCRYAQIQSISNEELSLGFWNGCIGPPSYSAIMTLEYNGVRTGNVGIGWTMTNPTYLLQLQTNSAAKPGSSSWTIASDRRLKKDIRPYSEGLDELRRINPVTYQYNGEGGIIDESRFVGVIAQELQEVAPHMVVDFLYVADDNSEEKYLGVDLNALQFIELNAIKELDQELQAQKEINARLRSELDEVKALVEKLVNGQQVNKHKAESALDRGARLEQNNPNPFTENTTIRYELPETSRSASIEVRDLNGTLIREFQLDGSQKSGSVVMEGESLAAGTYFYKLVIDRETVATRRLVLTH